MKSVIITNKKFDGKVEIVGQQTFGECNSFALHYRGEGFSNMRYSQRIHEQLVGNFQLDLL